MSRFLVAAGLLAALIWISSRATERSVALDPRERNVLLVTIDTLRADALGSAGGEAATPNLDRLARAGTQFDFAHAHSVVTLPSHASILTGLYPFAHGIRDNAGYRLRPGTTSIATFLQAQGYETGAFVGAFPLDARFGLGTGFDTYDDRYPSRGRASELLMPERRADTVVAAAVEWIRGRRGRWFAWVHLFDPHAPYQPPEPFATQYRSNPYAGEVAWVDHALGPLLRTIEESGQPTLILVTGDHGEALGAHGEATHGLFAYEDTLRVPLILSATDVRPRATPARSSTPARHVDLFPTIGDGLGLAVPAGLPGRSLRPGRDPAEGKNIPTYFEALTASLNRGWAPLTGVMLGREKYIDLPIPELYDLASDPAELRNEAGRRSGRQQVLSALLESFRAQARPQPRSVESAETRQRLEALGYVSTSGPRQGQYDEQDDPKRLVALDQVVQRGVELYQRGDRSGAVRAYEEAIRQRPTMATPYLHLAFLLWEAGEPAAAIGTLRAGLASGADTGEVRAQLGIYLAEAGAPTEAVGLLEAATAAAPTDLDALNGLGIALSRSGRAADAGRVFRQVLAADPGDVNAWQNLGGLALSRNDLRAARDAFASALALDPGLAGALNGIGIVELRSGNRPAAFEAWRQAVALDPRHLDALYNLGSELLREGDRDAARRYLQQFAAAAPPALYARDLARVRGWLGK